MTLSCKFNNSTGIKGLPLYLLTDSSIIVFRAFYVTLPNLCDFRIIETFHHQLEHLSRLFR